MEWEEGRVFQDIYLAIYYHYNIIYIHLFRDPLRASNCAALSCTCGTTSNLSIRANAENIFIHSRSMHMKEGRKKIERVQAGQAMSLKTEDRR